MDTFKIGVLFQNANQTTEQEILSNLYGSSRYERVYYYLYLLFNLFIFIFIIIVITIYFIYKILTEEKKFLKSLGKVVRLKNCTEYSGGLDRSTDTDGKWSLHWTDNVVEIMFHVTTLMPNCNSDGLFNFSNKKRHIGNNFVNIIYSESLLPVASISVSLIIIFIFNSVNLTFISNRVNLTL